jgi:hypothetical protein
MRSKLVHESPFHTTLPLIRPLYRGFTPKGPILLRQDKKARTEALGAAKASVWPCFYSHFGYLCLFEAIFVASP